MSIERNVIAIYAGQIYAILISVAMPPFYVKYLGFEAFGLVGFFTMLQAWFLLMDMGLTPTMAREVARFKGGIAEALSLRRLLRSLEAVFLGVAVLGAGCLILGADQIAGTWLKAEQLSTKEVTRAIEIMVLLCALRWMSELYRSVIAGYEHMLWLSVFSAGVSTVRSALAIPLFIWISNDITDFFLFQLGVSVIETVVLTLKAYALLPTVATSATLWNWKPLKGVMGFSLTVASANLVWIAASQTDKLILSGLLSLADYGWFSLAVLAASGVLLMTSPLSAVLFPRLSALHAQGNQAAMILLYRKATHWFGILVWPVCAMLAAQAERILWIWTGDTQLAAQAALTLCLYALGNGAMAIGGFPQYLQFAQGQLRLQLLGGSLFALLLVPCLFWTATTYGIAGAGWTWLTMNILYFTLWIPITHARIAPGLHSVWLLRDVAPIALLAFAAALASRWLPWPEQRGLAGLQVLVVSLGVLGSAALGSSWLRIRIDNWWRHGDLEWQG